ncbi:hypothetical protein ABZ671_06440 [Micromonospora sp. NPDC006766]|uniref:hypothetical protein n=1 Tax=Micromonospora sp. NPDC006766 TaxID=3154778 RepID=UPI0033E1D1A6
MMALYFVGLPVGSAMTSLAGNPAVNGADSDLSLAFCGLCFGLLLASISHVLTRPPHEPGSLSRDSGPDLARI